MKKKIIDEINKILIEWDPIDVGKDIATVEYKGYIPEILSARKNFNDLVRCLKCMIVNDIGLDYQKYNDNHKKDLVFIAYKIFIANKVHDIKVKKNS